MIHTAAQGSIPMLLHEMGRPDFPSNSKSLVCSWERVNRELRRSHGCRDPSIVVVGFSWDSADERKFRQTFQLGRSIMSRFLDLQSIGGMLGYRGYGLGSLSQQVMGLRMRKSKKVDSSHD